MVVRAAGGPSRRLLEAGHPQGAALLRPLRHDGLHLGRDRPVPRVVSPPARDPGRRVDAGLFLSPWVAPLLARAAPEAKLLLLLRDPVDRFRSGLDHAARSGRAASGSVIVDAVERGYYDRALTQWLEHFDPAQLLVLQYERCAADPAGVLAATFEFLGLADVAVPAASRPRSGGPGYALDDDARARLVELYAPDVAALSRAAPGDRRRPLGRTSPTWPMRCRRRRDPETRGARRPDGDSWGARPSGRAPRPTVRGRWPTRSSLLWACWSFRAE